MSKIILDKMNKIILNMLDDRVRLNKLSYKCIYPRAYFENNYFVYLYLKTYFENNYFVYLNDDFKICFIKKDVKMGKLYNFLKNYRGMK